MDVEAFYRPPLDLLSQGDIIEITPHVILKTNPLQVLRRQSGKGGQTVMRPFEYHLDSEEKSETPTGGDFKLDRPEGDTILAHASVTYGIVLSHGCDIDKNLKTRLMALVRALPEDVSDNDKKILRENRKMNFFYLPAYLGMKESYADFTRISCPAPQLIDDAPRLASLTDAAVALLQYHLLRFLTRREFPLDKLEVAQERQGGR